MDEPQEIERRALVADHESSEVAQPSKEPFDLPATAIASEWTAILGLRANPSTPMRRNHLDAPGGQGHIQWISSIGPISDEASWQGVYEAGVKGGRDEGHFVRRSRGGTRGERKTKTVCHRLSGHALRTLAPLGLSHTSAPLYIGNNV
jgi:hypothetical protein